jgi:tetratricopeptide (TPR) repeat protein
MKKLTSILLFLFSVSDIFSGNHNNALDGFRIEGVFNFKYKDYGDRSNTDSARNFVSKGLIQNDSGEYVKAIFYFTKAIEYDPTLPAAYLSRAFAKYQLMDYKGALNDYAKVRKLKLTWEESYELYYYQGITLLALKNLQEAMADFNYAIRLRPDQADAYYNRSIIKGRIGDYQGEVEDINKVLTLRPEDDNAYNSRGIAKSMLGDWNGAIVDYTKSIALNKTNANAYYNRAIILFESKKYLDALNDFNKSISLAPDAESYNRRANVKCRLKDFKGAFDDYSEAIKSDTNNYVALINRGYLKFDLKDYKSAIEDYDHALKIKPDYALAYYNRGQAKGKLGDLEGEINDYTKAIEYQPDYESAYTERGIAKYEIGDRAGGCQDLNQAVKLGSDQAYNQLKEYCK